MLPLVIVVQLLRLPGDARALVSPEVAELGERMGELRVLDRVADSRPPMREARRQRQ